MGVGVGGGCVGRRGGLIPGFALSLEPVSWLSLPEVAAGGWQCAVIPSSVSAVPHTPRPRPQRDSGRLRTARAKQTCRASGSTQPVHAHLDLDKAAVGTSVPGVIRRIFMPCCTPNRQNRSQSERAEKFRTNPGITQCLQRESPISPPLPCVLTQQTA
ncbi:unnamed protein product [Pleuronectes platessa]|uniref:Uncharacterized protein n=1 Tax=Pleuronectes platessa TaxID=8262 RepID=A0A9N7YXZ8_PLEPL|nr:unnamed protein product [Pleuronectes platessa]